MISGRSRARKRECGARVSAIGLSAVALAALLAPALAQARPGDLDRSFGRDGKVSTRIARGFHSGAASVAIDSRGRIVAAGGSARSHFSEFALARYRRNTGRLDRSFSRNGKVTTEFRGGASGAASVAIDPRGRIVAAGFTTAGDGQFALARYKPNGSLDRSFSGNGRARTRFEEGAFANSVAIDSRGRIVAAGLAHAQGGTAHFGLARYRWNGDLDRSFGSVGRVTTGFGGEGIAASVAIDPRGRIIAAGGTTEASGEFAVARYQPNGDLDPASAR